jgi:hypothetical protein
LLQDTILLFVVATLVFVPLGRYAAEEPTMFGLRGVSRLVGETPPGTPPATVGHLVGVFFSNVKNALLMFNWKGDVVWTNTIPNLPMLEPTSGALFVLGCVYAAYRLIRFRELPFLYLFVLLFDGLLPSIMTLGFPQENPSTVRTGMAIPITATFIALPLALIGRRVVAGLSGGRGPVAAGGLVALLLASAFRNNFYEYYVVYPAQHARASQHTSAVGRTINGFFALGGRREDAHILPGAYWIDTRLVAIETGDIKWDPLLRNVDDARKQDGLPRPRLYVVKPDDRENLDKLARWYPNAIRQDHALRETDNTPWYTTLLVPPNTNANS